MKGYKGFDNKFQCIGLQYEVGETYSYVGDIKICSRGFHFCKKLSDVLNFYPLNPKFRHYISLQKLIEGYFTIHNRYAEVECLGRYITNDHHKYVTDRIRIIRELSTYEICEILQRERENKIIAREI